MSSTPLPLPCSPPVFEGSCKPRCFFGRFFRRVNAGQFGLLLASHCDVFEPVDLIHGHDLLNDDTFYNILVLAESGLIGAALAARYCSKHSRATLRRPGPRLVRLVSQKTLSINSCLCRSRPSFTTVLVCSFRQWIDKMAWPSWKIPHPV